jgi:hypothetical protein
MTSDPSARLFALACHSWVVHVTQPSQVPALMNNLAVSSDHAPQASLQDLAASVSRHPNQCLHTGVVILTNPQTETSPSSRRCSRAWRNYRRICRRYCKPRMTCCRVYNRFWRPHKRQRKTREMRHRTLPVTPPRAEANDAVREVPAEVRGIMSTRIFTPVRVAGRRQR